MDIYQYVNSKAIREHLRNINYKFNSKEAIWLVHENYELTFEEKCKAWEEIMFNMDDMPYTYTNKESNIKNLTIFGVLKDWIKYHRESIILFKVDSDNYYYEIESYLEKERRDNHHVNTTFKHFNDAINYIKNNKKWISFPIDNYDKSNGKWIWTEFKFDSIRIEKKEFGNTQDIASLDLNNNLDIKSVSMLNSPEDEKNCYIHEVIFLFFYRMWFNFPVPFKEGDIVYNPRDKEIGKFTSGPFIFLENGNFGSDSSDMVADGYFVWDDGEIYNECTFSYMDLEYYEDKITGPIRSLLLISNFLKGKIDISLCIKAYHYILIDELHKKNGNSLNYTSEGLELAGLKELVKKDGKNYD